MATSEMLINYSLTSGAFIALFYVICFIFVTKKTDSLETGLTQKMTSTNIRIVTENDLDRCFEIESVSYAGDEAASRSKILKRILRYPEGFIVLENRSEIIGFINSGATHRVELSDEEFKELIGHDPKGAHIVVMSVVVHPDYQGKGHASMLLDSFTKTMKTAGKTDIYLICVTEMIGLYEKHGYRNVGVSDSDHGGLSWHEMSLSLQQQ